MSDTPSGSGGDVEGRAVARDGLAAPAQVPFAVMQGASKRFRVVVAPLMLLGSSVLMALAWLGHLNFQDLHYALALLFCWLLVLPEYFLNITALRLGHPVFSGALMAAFRLCAGVVCVALVSRFVLGEDIRPLQLAGFGLMIVALGLIASGSTHEGTEGQAP
ncbi:DMT family protein [Planctomycetota bacterium]|nr:DMT family protein [Planctomycetota bacterium]